MAEKSNAPSPTFVTVPVPAPDSAKTLSEARNGDERVFLELRRKVQNSELISAATERLLAKMRFNGRLSVVVQNGRVVKSGYEEGYFRRKNDLQGWNPELES